MVGGSHAPLGGVNKTIVVYNGNMDDVIQTIIDANQTIVDANANLVGHNRTIVDVIQTIVGINANVVGHIQTMVDEEFGGVFRSLGSNPV